MEKALRTIHIGEDTERSVIISGNGNIINIVGHDIIDEDQNIINNIIKSEPFEKAIM